MEDIFNHTKLIQDKSIKFFEQIRDQNGRTPWIEKKAFSISEAFKGQFSKQVSKQI